MPTLSRFPLPSVEVLDQRERRLKQNRSFSPTESVAELVCMVEGPLGFLYSCALALGQGGPNMMPTQIHSLFFASLVGWEIFTTLAMTTFTQMAWERRSSEAANALRERVKRNRILGIGFFLGPIVETILVILRAANYDYLEAADKVGYTVWAALTIVAQTVLAGMFILHGVLFIKPIRAYFR